MYIVKSKMPCVCGCDNMEPTGEIVTRRLVKTGYLKDEWENLPQPLERVYCKQCGKLYFAKRQFGSYTIDELIKDI